MIATIINCLTVIIGSIIGLISARGIKDGYRDVVFNGAGVATLVIGVSMAFESGNFVYLVLALILGGLLGTRLDIDGAILRFGVLLERLLRFGRPTDNPARDAAGGAEGAGANGGAIAGWDFGHGFLNASVLFCVGAMALVGSFKAGTEGDYTLILTKSVLDGFMAIFFAAALGPGVAFSALPILVYQGILTLAAGALKPFVTEAILNELTGIGGALVVMIGLNLLGLKKIKTADFLPALVFIVALAAFDPIAYLH